MKHRKKKVYREKYPYHWQEEKDIVKYPIWKYRKLCKDYYGGDVFFEWLREDYPALWRPSRKLQRQILKEYKKQVREWFPQDWEKVEMVGDKIIKRG